MSRLLVPTLAAVAFLHAGMVIADIEELSLYQRTARSALVVRARSLSSSTRRPRVRVLEVLKGHSDLKEITVVPHFENHAQPTPWLDREVFHRGEDSILFLLPYVDAFGRDGGSSTFSVLGAASGKLAVPAEGSDALLRAVRRFSEILAMGQHDAQAEGLLGLLRESNPWMIEAGLGECARYTLARPGDFESLLQLVGHSRPSFRAGSLVLLRQIAETGKTAGIETRAIVPGESALLIERAASLLRLDAEPLVRMAAINVIRVVGGDAAIVLLDEAGRNDSAQAVRYAAQVAAAQLKSALR